MSKQFNAAWKFTDNDGTFEIKSADKTSYLVLYYLLFSLARLDLF